MELNTSEREVVYWDKNPAEFVKALDKDPKSSKYWERFSYEEKVKAFDIAKHIVNYSVAALAEPAGYTEEKELSDAIISFKKDGCIAEEFDLCAVFTEIVQVAKESDVSTELINHTIWYIMGSPSY